MVPQNAHFLVLWLEKVPLCVCVCGGENHGAKSREITATKMHDKKWEDGIPDYGFKVLEGTQVPTLPRCCSKERHTQQSPLVPVHTNA